MRVLKTMLVSIACLFVLLAHAAAQSLPAAAPQELGFSPERLARISSWLRDDIAKGTIPGAVLMIVRHGKVAHFEAAGVARSRDQGADDQGCDLPHLLDEQADHARSPS
jgi:CubicO group peptidase (beta-lactamase class C family)